MNKNNIWNYSESDDGVIERTVYIKAKKCGDPIRIAHLTDMHFNFCNEKDIKENDPVLMSTYANREWLKNGSSVENAKRSLKHAKDADAIVIGPGSLYTSVIPNLLVDGVVEAIMASSAKKIYVCNIMTQPGETDAYSVASHVNALLNHAKYVDYEDISPYLIKTF